MPIAGALQLEGTLDHFPLEELIGIITSTGVTGVLEIGSGNIHGRLFCRDGHLYHVETAESVGFNALCQLFEEHRAPFRFVSGMQAETVTVWHDALALAERAKQHAEQWQQVRTHIQDLNAVPVLLDTAQQARVQISETTWPILAAVDGKRSITEIALTTAHAPLDVCLGIAELLRQGVVALTTHARETAHVRANKPPAASFFKRVQHSS